jgi:photosystem II stability/assembly factor-like uncharacterized protein
MRPIHLHPISFLSIFLSMLLFCIDTSAQSYGWVDTGQTIPGDSLFHDLSDLYFISDDEGWITSSSHPEIYHTTDGGANWNFHGTITSTLNDIAFPPQSDTGYTCGDNGKIYIVTSSGVTPMISNAGTVNLQSITFPATTEGWCCGESVIIHYLNHNWNTDQVHQSAGYNDVYFVPNTTTGWAAAGWHYGTFITHTIDGYNWVNPGNLDTANALMSVFFLDAQQGWTVGTGGIIFSTTNGGAEWSATIGLC